TTWRKANSTVHISSLAGLRKTSVQIGFIHDDECYQGDGQDVHLLDWFCGRNEFNSYWKDFMGSRHFKAASRDCLGLDEALCGGLYGDDELDAAHGAGRLGIGMARAGAVTKNLGVICDFNNGWDADCVMMQL
ncbi:MAG: hypothetical protein Q9175_008206, partial [Cornicularia normoerica]